MSVNLSKSDGLYHVYFLKSAPSTVIMRAVQFWNQRGPINDIVEELDDQARARTCPEPLPAARRARVEQQAPPPNWELLSDASASQLLCSFFA